MLSMLMMMQSLEYVLMGEGSLEVVLMWIGAWAFIQVLRSLLVKIEDEDDLVFYKSASGLLLSLSYFELPQPVIVPLKVSTEDLLLASHQPRQAPVFSLFTVYEESNGSMECLLDLKSFGVRFEKIKSTESTESIDAQESSLHYYNEAPCQPVPSKLLALSKSLRFASNYDLTSSPAEDEIKTITIDAVSEKPAENDQPWTPPRPRTPDFSELLRRMPKVESIFDEPEPECIEILDRVDEALLSKSKSKAKSIDSPCKESKKSAIIKESIKSAIIKESIKQAIKPKDAVKILFACNIL